ncbi:MAG: HlyD family efflux transporter periplasmic adaptor subunit [Planctomycetes bacterium]|nr:HlyD family efflux transporter periplasmic adaptor subunit [Planctomycetota bacterium]
MSHVDLTHLRMQPGSAPSRRPLGPRLLALAALTLLLATAATFVWPLLRSPRTVPMAAVRLLAGENGAAADPGAVGTLAEAVGWVEPDPFPHVVRPLVDGRIESIEVLEGATVEAGKTVLARLASAELLAAKERAAVAVAEAEASLANAETVHRQAVLKRRQNAEPRQRAAEAAMATATVKTRLDVGHKNALRLAAEADGADAALQAQRSLLASGGSNEVALRRAEAAKAAADAAAAATTAELRGLEHELAAARASQAVADEVAETPVELDTAVAVADSEQRRAAAALAAARTQQVIADREFAWTTVLAPIDGVVLKLLASPGDDTGPRSVGVLSLYDPQHLRARIDVPLGSFDGIAPGIAVEIRSEVTGDAVVGGVVQRLQHESDLLKNTLQVKVGLAAPPAILRPETLVRARFLGAANGRTGQAGGEPGRGATAAFVLPKAAVQGDQVFVFDPRLGTARAVVVQVQATRGDEVVVRGELSATQKVVLVPVTAGERLQEQTR